MLFARGRCVTEADEYFLCNSYYGRFTYAICGLRMSPYIAPDMRPAQQPGLKSGGLCHFRRSTVGAILPRRESSTPLIV